MDSFSFAALDSHNLDLNAEDAFAVRASANVNIERRFCSFQSVEGCVPLTVGMTEKVVVPVTIKKNQILQWKILNKYYSIAISIKSKDSDTLLFPVTHIAADGSHVGLITAGPESNIDAEFIFDNSGSLFSRSLLYCFKILDAVDDKSRDVFDTGTIESSLGAQSSYSLLIHVPKGDCVVYKVLGYGMEISLTADDGTVLHNSLLDRSGVTFGALAESSIDRIISVLFDNSKSNIFNWRTLSWRILVGPRAQIQTFDSGPFNLTVARWSKICIPFFVPKFKTVSWKVEVKSPHMIPYEIGVGVNVKPLLVEKSCTMLESAVEDEVCEPVTSKSYCVDGRAPDQRDREMLLVLDNTSHLNLCSKDITYSLIIGDDAFRPGSDLLLSLSGKFSALSSIGEVFFVVVDALKILGSSVSSQLKNDYAIAWIAYIIFTSLPYPIQKATKKEDILGVLKTNRNLIIILIEEADENTRMTKVLQEVLPLSRDVFEKLIKQGVNLVNPEAAIDLIVDTVHSQLGFPVNKIVSKSTLSWFFTNETGKKLILSLGTSTGSSASL